MTKTNFNTRKVTSVSQRVTDWLDDKKPTIALTLGSGLGGFGADVPDKKEEHYRSFGLPTPAVEGHAGKLRFAELNGKGVLIFDGRIHCYEGYDMQEVVLGVRAATMAGAKIHILTCASGAVNSGFSSPGKLVIIRDHINLMDDSPLVGINSGDRPRFPDMTETYDKELRQLAGDDSHRPGYELKEAVYAAMLGPQYETPAEIRMLRAVGADLVGMSTVPEVIALRHLGARVLAISCVTNYAAGVTDQPLSHDEVTAAGAAAAPRFRQLLTAIINALPH